MITGLAPPPPLPIHINTPSFHVQGGAIVISGDILVKGPSKFRLALEGNFPNTYDAFVLAYVPNSFTDPKSRSLTWMPLVVSFWGDLKETSFYLTGCTVNFLKDIFNNVIPFPIISIREPVVSLINASEVKRPVSVTVVACATGAISNLPEFGTDHQDVRIAVVPKSGRRHENEVAMEMEVIIAKKVITLKETGEIYIKQGTAIEVSGPIVYYGENAPLTIYSNAFIPSPLSGFEGSSKSNVLHIPKLP